MEDIVDFSIFLRHDNDSSRFRVYFSLFNCLSLTVFQSKNLPFENKALVGYRSTSHRVEADDLDEFCANYFSSHREKNFFLIFLIIFILQVSIFSIEIF